MENNKINAKASNFRFWKVWYNMGHDYPFDDCPYWNPIKIGLWAYGKQVALHKKRKEIEKWLEEKND